MKPMNAQRRRGGFTLVEILIVLAILVLLVSMVMPKVLSARKKGNVDAAKSQIGLLKGALEHYALDCNDYPVTEQGLEALLSKPSDLNENTSWKGPYLTGEVPKDPWGNEYQYKYPPENGTGDTPDIWSLGPDGEDNTADDICSWSGSSSGRGEEGDMDKERPAESRKGPRTESRSESRSESRKEGSAPKRASTRSTAPRTEKKSSEPL